MVLSTKNENMFDFYIENVFVIWYNNINLSKHMFEKREECSMRKKTTFVVTTKSNRVKEIVSLESQDDAISYVEEKYLYYIKSVPRYDYKNSFIKDDRSLAVVSAGIFSVKIMIYQGNIQKIMSGWKDKK